MYSGQNVIIVLSPWWSWCLQMTLNRTRCPPTCPGSTPVGVPLELSFPVVLAVRDARSDRSVRPLDRNVLVNNLLVMYLRISSKTRHIISKHPSSRNFGPSETREETNEDVKYPVCYEITALVT